MEITQELILSACERKNYKLKSQSGYVDIVGVRSKDFKLVNMFNDFICLLWIDSQTQKAKFKACPATTKPGLPALLKPLNPKGCAILAPGMYEFCWSIGLHRGKYPALCQILEPVTVYRDADKDREFDLVNPETGFFGINIHRASAFQKLPVVGWNSAGCQVFQDPKDFDLLMELAQAQSFKYGNQFSYILLNESDLLDV